MYKTPIESKIISYNKCDCVCMCVLCKTLTSYISDIFYILKIVFSANVIIKS